MKLFFTSEEEARGLGKGGCFMGSDSLPREVVPTGARAPIDKLEMGPNLKTPQLLVAPLFLPWGRIWPSFPTLFYYLYSSGSSLSRGLASLCLTLGPHRQ